MNLPPAILENQGEPGVVFHVADIKLLPMFPSGEAISFL